MGRGSYKIEIGYVYDQETLHTLIKFSKLKMFLFLALIVRPGMKLPEGPLNVHRGLFNLAKRAVL